MNAILDTVDSHAYDLDEEGEGVENPVEDSVGADLRAWLEGPQIKKRQTYDPQQVQDHHSDNHAESKVTKPLGEVLHAETEVHVLSNQLDNESSPEAFLLRAQRLDFLRNGGGVFR